MIDLISSNQRRSIMKNVFASITFLLLASPAHAQWCAIYQNGGSNCYFKSQAQCLATISGVGGTCSPTQAERPAATEPRTRPAKPSSQTAKPQKIKPTTTATPRPSETSPRSAPPTSAELPVAAKPPVQGALPPKFNEARQLVLEGQYEVGVAALHALANDHHPDIATFLGLAYFKLGRNDQAAFWYDSALGTNPNHRLALSYSGMLQVSLGDLRGAQAALKKIHQLCGADCNEYKALEAVLSASRR